MRHRITHFLHDAWHHIWNTLLAVNSVLFAFAFVYLIYSAGASIYYFTPQPFEVAFVLAFALLCSELLIAGIEEIVG